jgi:hypothetical protein
MTADNRQLLASAGTGLFGKLFLVHDRIKSISKHKILRQ